MFACTHILAVFDPHTHELQPALARALTLAKRVDGCKVTLVSCIYDSTFDMTNILTSEERFDMKQALVLSQKEKMQKALAQYPDAEVNIEVVWHKKVHKGLVNLATEENCDLIIKSCKAHEKIGQKLFTPHDWQLLRESSVNVLMVKDHDWPDNGKIVAALSINANDKTHSLLNDKIVATAQALTGALNAELHLANTFVGAPIHVSVEVPSFSAEVYNQTLKEKHTELMKAVAKTENIPESNLHIAEGLPEDIIPEWCSELDAEMLVLGSVGRSGLSAALLGNTAEHIIDQLNCDTLVVKP
ncbi:universal stress protein UspE [Glaciecola sp. 1036]|uniref:universal stress protein UspE n=1 Tax=Alteromonadaceae TaxID=72275 RepID=UPI003D03C5E4